MMRPVPALRTIALLIALYSASPAGQSVFDVKEYGAIGDGVTNDRGAIQKALDACARTGGTVRVPSGRYLTGSLVLGDNTDLLLEGGAVILGSTRLEDYKPHVPALRSYNDAFLRYSLFYAEGRTNITIRGSGTIDGQGSAFVVATREKPARYMNRPFVIRFVQCRNVTVTGVTLQNSAMWMQHYLACEDVIIRGIRVWNHANKNNDMMDIDGCRNVIVDDCIGDTEDDAITLKSTSTHVTENVTISNCIISSHCNAIKTGTESTGGFRNITVSNVVVKPSANTVASVGFPSGISGITLATVDGGMLERVSIRDCIIDGPQVPIFIRLGNRGRKHDPDAPTPGVGRVQDISISGIRAVAGGPVGCSISGIPGHPVTRIHLSDLDLTFPGGGTAAEASREPEEAEDAYPESTHWGSLPAYGVYIRHAENLSLSDVRLQYQGSDSRPAVVASDVRGLNITGLRARGEMHAPSLLRFHDVVHGIVQGSAATTDVACFLSVTGASEGIALLANDLRRAGVTICPEKAVGVFTEGNIVRSGR